MSNDTSNQLAKQCSKCNKLLPATSEHFNKHPSGKYGLHAQCKPCRKAYRAANRDKLKAKRRQYYLDHKAETLEKQKEYVHKNRDRILERQREWYLNNSDHVTYRQTRSTAPYRVCTSCKRELPQTEEYFYFRKDYNRYVSKCNECLKEHRATRYKESRVEILERQRSYRVMYPRRGFPRRIDWLNRRARKRGLVANLSKADWQRALNYWHNVCAYCGNQQDFFHTIEADHFIPLIHPDCPGTVATNMIPACRSCNAAKIDKDASIWLTETYGARKAQKILAQIENYFDWVRAQP